MTEFAVRSACDTHALESVIQEVFTVSARWHPVVDEQGLHNLITGC